MQNDNSAIAPDSANSQSSAFDYDSLDSENSIVIKFHTEAIKERIQRSNRDIIEIGERLMDVKERLPHGQFGLWLQVEFSWDERTARRFMSVAAMFKNDTVSFLDFKSDTVSVLDCVEAGTMNIATGALYILAAKSTPEETRREVLERAYHGEQFTQAKVKRIVAEQKTKRSTKKPKEKAQSSDANEDFAVGDWVGVQTRNGNPNWDELQGTVTRVEQHEITVELNDGGWKRLRFYRDELIKLAPQFYRPGSMILVNCPISAEKEFKRLNGRWGMVKSIGRSGSVEVVIGGEIMRLTQNYLDPMDNPDADLKVVAEKVNRLLQRDDLTGLERYMLDWYSRQFSFSDRDLQILDTLVAHYEGAA